MKTKFVLLGLLGIPLVVGSAAVIYCNDEISFEPSVVARNKATATTTGKFQSVEQGARIPGNHFYVGDFTWADGNPWYFGDNYVEAVFANSDATVTATVRLSGVESAFESGYLNDETKKYVECVVPKIPSGSDTEWAKVKCYRKSKTSEATWNETDYKSLSGTLNALRVWNDGCELNTFDYWERLRIFAWYQDWSHPEGDPNASKLCSNTSDLSDENLEKLETQWGLSETAFNALGNDIKYRFSSVTARADDPSWYQPSYEGTAARYDWIYSKYSQGYGITLSNWADRTIA